MMAKDQINYRLVLEAGDVRSASEPAPLENILTGFNEQIARGVFRPTSGRRLLVLSEEQWLSWRSLAKRAAALNPEAADRIHNGRPHVDPAAVLGSRQYCAHRDREQAGQL